VFFWFVILPIYLLGICCYLVLALVELSRNLL
jgi:hypothetical protein